jgi:hypothetical protein
MKSDEKAIKRKRLEISLNLENKEDREVWNILKKKKNINAYFRQAVLYQAKGQRLDWQTAQDIQETIRTTICELFSSGSVPVGVGTSSVEPLPDTMIQDEPTSGEEAPEEVSEATDENFIDLSGFEDFL